MPMNHVTHQKPKLTDSFLEGFTGWEDGARVIGAARKMLAAMVPALARWLESRGSDTFLELDGFERGVNSALLHIRNTKDFRVIVVRAVADSILSFDGKDVFLAGKGGAGRLADILMDAVASITPTPPKLCTEAAV